MAMVVRRSVWLALAGVVPGVGLAYVVGRSMEALLAGVKPFDAPTFAGAVALALIMTVAGSLLPARRALRVDPIVAIRAE
jgi:ABC-type antimicrobial peptide transport system permease subunit